MLEKVWDYVKKHRMLEEQDRVIVGVSGGADSVALFRLLREFQKKMDFSIYVVHVNHHIRGEEAQRDAEFVRDLCRKEKVPFREYSYEIKEMAKSLGIGQEEAGRQARMEAFETQRKAVHGTKIALAHHENDLAETMLHHLCRGTGLKGMCGILPVQGNKIRPLLCLERKEIEHYLKEQQIAYVTDSTNASDDYTRNRIRNQILPRLENQVNQKSVRHLAEAAEKLREVEAYLARQARAVLDAHEYGKEGMGLDNGFFGEEGVVEEYAILLWLDQSCKKRKDVTSVHVKQILSLGEKKPGKYAEIPGGWCVVRRDWGIQVEMTEKVRSGAERTGGDLQAFPWKPEQDSSLFLAGRKITGRIFSYCGQEIPEKTYTKWLNYDKIKGSIRFRKRLPGDYLVVNAQGGRKKLKDYFIDSRIPREQRNDIWLLAMDSEILLILGYRISEAYKITKDTKKVLEIKYEEGE